MEFVRILQTKKCSNCKSNIFVVWKALKKEALNFPVQETWAICGNTLKKDALKKEALNFLVEETWAICGNALKKGGLKKEALKKEVLKQARKAWRCDSNFQSETLNHGPTHSPTH